MGTTCQRAASESGVSFGGAEGPGLGGVVVTANKSISQAEPTSFFFLFSYVRGFGGIVSVCVTLVLAGLGFRTWTWTTQWSELSWLSFLLCALASALSDL